MKFFRLYSNHLQALPADLDFAASADSYALAMPMRREERQLLIR